MKKELIAVPVFDKFLGVLEFNLPKIMRERGLTVAQVSEMTGLTGMAIYAMRQRVPARIALLTIFKLCRGLGLAPSDLFVIRYPKKANGKTRAG